MDDLATLSAQPGRILLGGAEYTIHPLTLADLGKFQAWIDWQTDPFRLVQEAIDNGNYSMAQQKFMFEAATAQARHRIKLGMPEADALMTSMEGVLELLTLAIGKGDPAFTADRAKRIYATLTFADVRRVFDATGATLVMSDPKAATAGTTTT